jgi:hypothetical protein
MSRTTGIQNYLSNVFRPIYRYDTTANVFVPSLEVTNVDTYSGNSVSVFTAAVGDANNNVYVGSNAGNAYNFLKSVSKVTALGYGAASNISNDCNSVYIGWFAGKDALDGKDVISIGTSSAGGLGSSNIFIGTNTGTVGNSNILVGHYIRPGDISNQFRLGLSNKFPIAADLSLNWVGLGGILNPTTNAKIDVSGSTRIQGNLSVNLQPGERTLDVNGNFRARDSSLNTLDFSNGFLTSSGGYTSTQGSISAGVGTTTIGTLKKGIVQVSTVDVSSTANRAGYLYFAYDISAASILVSNIAGDTDLALSTSNIQISNVTSTKTYNFSITYFPMP